MNSYKYMRSNIFKCQSINDVKYGVYKCQIAPNTIYQTAHLILKII